MSYDTMAVVPDEFRADVKRAIDVLRSEGASEVYVFGLVDLDQDSRFVRAIREWGPIERVG